ncbi:MAG TPA: D-alanyl-lipoteichoic acid biosynthesis protein DltD [Candidatus Udaeobacter sp.]|jgi:D-alanine transfer protein|nr:D-alanyl-lipoteichoic acid biosynthesis protein DltD [Candidatus Udaeobacter sp.]
MERPKISRCGLHLFSGLIASCLAAAALFGVRTVAVHREHATVLSTAPELFPLKNQGLAFQRSAAFAPNVLPFYASSELTALSIPERANIFFRTAPTGFQVSPVGAGGMAPLNILQKVAALGSDLRGKRLAISLSPGLTTNPGCRSYDGNFSIMAASEMVFGTALDFELKQQIASRMLKCPSDLKKSPLVDFAVRLLASGRWFDRIVFYALWPIGKVQNTLLETHDHFAALSHIQHKIKPAPRRHLETIDWPNLISKVNALAPTKEDKTEKTSSLHKPVASGSRDTAFENSEETAPGWTDLELLLRTLASVHARPLLLSMPFDGHSYDQRGISRSGRDSYYNRLHALAEQYHFALIEFKGHDEDPAFLYLHKSHLTAKGWIYYDRALDDFFHRRLPES